MSSRILIIEDEPGLRLALTDRLAADGYEVAGAADGEEGLRRATEEHFDLVILDVMLPRRSGLDVCRDLRQQGNPASILMLTARGEVVDRVVGLKLGADDYLTKPFAMAELMARVEARLRSRPTPAGPSRDAYRFGAVHVDFRSAEVTREGQRVELSAKEFQLLRHFIEHRGKVLSRDELLNGVWGYDAMPTTRTVDVHVAALRRKLEPKPHVPAYILTLHGLGYKFVG
jgi:two-component system, OmpR family, alkaline phosphatase synthesis response regulator PhoP